MSDYDLRVGRIVFINGKGDIIYAQEGECSPNPLEYAPKGTLKELTQAQARIKELEALVREAVSLVVSGDGTCWFCSFCGAHGSEQLHYDNCFTERPEVKAIMEKKDDLPV